MGKRFRVAFSFAGEKRDFVAEAAKILAKQFGEVCILYDKFLESEFSRPDLAFYLPNLYENEADLVVGVFCREYVDKEWCGLEWRAIYSLLKKKSDQTVMLSRFDQVEPEGLYGLAGFIDLDDKTPAQFADLIRERLAINEGRSSVFYKTSLPATGCQQAPTQEWPNEPSNLLWHMANHREAQEAFARLISHAEPKQLLLIKGDTQTGKSHLSKQFHSNASSILGLRCGRFDFKGVEDLETEMQGFADQLEVTVPTDGSISMRLGQVLQSLREKPKPTLLIFDTFEAAGDAQLWIAKSLLPGLFRSPWLRTVIMGQPPLLKCSGEPWERCSMPPIQLSCPPPEEWLAYGQRCKPNLNLNLDFVTKVHALSEGKSTLLDQLLGPSN